MPTYEVTIIPNEYVRDQGHFSTGTCILIDVGQAEAINRGIEVWYNQNLKKLPNGMPPSFTLKEIRDKITFSIREIQKG